MHASIPPKSGISAALQIQFECDQDKGVLPPPKPITEIMPMCHDFEDPIFQHVMSMVQKSIAHHIKYPREVNNFGANNYKNE